MNPKETVLVKSSDAAREVVALNRTTGAFEIRPASDRTHGFGHVIEGTACAVYADGGDLILQCGARRWSLRDASVKLSVTRNPDGKINTFRVEANGRSEFEVSYPSALSDPLNRADPSFDVLDEETEDFFLWLARAANDPQWVANVIRTWGAA